MIIPQIITTLNGTENRMDPISHDLAKHRTIYAFGEINKDYSLSICTQLRYLQSKGNNDIYMFINSPGGSVSDGLMIYDLMKNLSCDVVTIGAGVAASMGSILLSAGSKGKRCILPNAEVMIHQPWGGAQGQATEILVAADHIKDTRVRLNQILADNCGKDLETLMKDTERDHWMTAQEALDYGIVDHVGFPEII